MAWQKESLQSSNNTNLNPLPHLLLVMTAAVLGPSLPPSLPHEADSYRDVSCYPKDEWSDFLFSIFFLIACAKYIQPI